MEDYRLNEIVFYSAWFEKHQEKLLSFANTFIGRKILKIDGKKSDVGDNEITKIEPHAIHWQNEDGSFTVEYRTHAKFAKRLYHFFRPLWETMHFFDMHFANKYVPEWNLGFDTLTAYPDANPETNSVDGGTWLVDSSTDRAWSTIRSAGANNVSDSATTIVVGGYFCSTTSNQFWGLYRSFFLFNTSSIGATGAITAATLSLFGSSKQNTAGGNFNTNIYSSNPASNTSLSTSDHGSLGTTAFSSNIAYNSWNASAYNSFALNSSGIAAISKTGITKFGGRTANDAENVAPTWASFGNANIQCYSADQSGTGNDPRLSVTYFYPATVTNSTNFTIENSIPLTISNPNNFWVRAELYVNSVLIKTQDLGQVSSATLTTNSGENSAMYAQTPNSTSVSSFVRLKSYSDSGYSTQIGSNQDKAGTASVNSATNAPTFANYSLSNVDTTITVQDKYGNTVASSSTQTLLGSSTDRFIKGYSKVRASITTGNKMTPKNSATGNKYRYANASQFDEQAFSSVATVNSDLDNVTVNSFSVTAFDSRGLTTQVTKTMALMADYSPVTLFNVTAQRDNNVDPSIVLAFSGTFWKKYFSSNTTSNPGNGVLNDVVIKYRYKETTQSWGAQSWTTITGNASIDSNGNITFSHAVNGDLGASGFTVSKSFNIEVVIYDRLSNIIVETTLNKGEPVMDWTQSGVSVKALYSASEGGHFQVHGTDILKLLGRKNVFDNILLNNNFHVWQKGGGAFTDFSNAVLSYSCDGWQTYRGGFVTGLSLTRQTAEIEGSAYAIRLQRVAGNTSTQPLVLGQGVENAVSVVLRGKPLTLTFYAKVGANFSASNLTAVIASDTVADRGMTSGNGDLQASINVPSTTTSKTKFTLTLSSLPSTCNTLKVYFIYTPVGTAGANDWFEIEQVQLDPTIYPLPFSPLRYEDELRRCRRIFQRMQGDTYASLGSGNSIISTRSLVYVKFLETMRTKPTAIGFSGLMITDRTAYDLTVTSIEQAIYTPESAQLLFNHSGSATSRSPCNLSLASTSGFLDLFAGLT